MKLKVISQKFEGPLTYQVHEGVPNYVNAHVRAQMKREFGLDVKKGLYSSLMDNEDYKKMMDETFEKIEKNINDIRELKGQIKGGRRTRGKRRTKSRRKSKRRKRRKKRRKSKGRKRRRKKRTKRR